MVLPTHDTSDAPEERTMLLFLGYLFGRLVESSNQLRAALKIQKRVRRKIEMRKREEEAIRISKAAYIIRRRVGTYMQVCTYRSIIAEWRAYKSISGPLFADGEYSIDEFPFDNLEKLEEEQEEYLRSAFEGEESRRSTDEDDKGEDLMEVEALAINKFDCMANIDSGDANDNIKSRADNHDTRWNVTVQTETHGENSINYTEIIPNIIESGNKEEGGEEEDHIDETRKVIIGDQERIEVRVVSDLFKNVEIEHVLVVSNARTIDRSEEEDLIVRINGSKEMRRGFLRLQVINCYFRMFL